MALKEIAAGLLLGVGLALPAAGAEPDYTVGDLLHPCFEGDADSRWGESLEANCEQYIRGFTDAYFHLSASLPVPELCFPAGPNRLDLIRWAFVEWARRNTDKQDWPAARGLIAAVKEKLACE